VVAAWLALVPGMAHAAAADLGAVPQEARTFAQTLDVRDGARVESTEVEIAGLPLRRPLGRMLVDDATGEVIATISHGDVPPWRGAVVLSEADAIRIVEDSGLPGSRGATEARLVADPRPSGTVAVWLVDPPLDPVTLSNPLFAVNAETGDLHRLYDQASSVKLQAYRRNPALDEAPGVFTALQFDAGSPTLRGPIFAAMNCLPGRGEACRASHLAAPTNAAGDFLHPPPDVDDPDAVLAPLDPFAEVSLYYHADNFMGWLRTFGIASLDCTDHGQLATLVANYRVITDEGWLPYNNARYTAKCDRLFVFGQGDDVDYAYDGDVVAHEIGHAVVDKVNGNVRLLEPRLRQDALVVDAGALNEAFADFLAQAFAGDPALAEYIGTYGGGGGSIRNADNGFTCPESFGGEVHQDSEAMAGALWEGREAWGNAMVKIVIGTIAILPDDASMEQGAAALVKVTRWRLGEAAASQMEQILGARGLLECRRIVALQDLRGSLDVQPPEYAVPYAPPPLQLRVDVPPGAASMHLEWEAELKDDESGGSIRPGVLVKYGAPFTYGYDTSQGWPPTLVHGADALYEDAFDGEVAMRVTSGISVYLAFVNGGDEVMRVKAIEVGFDDDTVETGGPTTDGELETDTATDSITDTLGLEPPEEEGKKGCACRSTSAPSSAWLVALLLALGLRRRRNAITPGMR
jgi:MYXO-CTERM domain-containing protein